jgi:hypothetical protein
LKRTDEKKPPEGGFFVGHHGCSDRASKHYCFAGSAAGAAAGASVAAGAGASVAAGAAAGASVAAGAAAAGASAGAAASSFWPQAVKANAANKAAKRTDFFMIKLTKIKD